MATRATAFCVRAPSSLRNATEAPCEVKECHVQPHETGLVRGCGEAVVDSDRYVEKLC